MIYVFRFKNFYSFAEKCEVSFMLNRQVPDSDLLFESPRGARLSKMMAVIGPNASGKTNILKSLSFLSDFASNSFSNKPDTKIAVSSHFFSDEEDSEFEIEFELKGEHYRYSLTANSERVVHESLYRKTSRSFSFIFERDWCHFKSAYEVKQREFGLAPSEAAKVRQNVSLIATAAQYNISCAVEIAEYFRKYVSNVRFTGPDYFDPGLLYDCASFFHRRPQFREQMSNILGKLDLGFADVTVESASRVSNTGVVMDVHIPGGLHRSNGKEAKLPLSLESSGTQVAFVLLRWILPALNHGWIVIRDELEAHLHPEFVEAVLELFIDPEQNPGNAQILFTCHTHEIFNFLQKEQVVLVEKDAKGRSEAWRLSDVKGVRRDDNLYAKYRAGAYGAIPDLAI